MKPDDFQKFMMRTRYAPMDERVVAALDHPDVQEVLQRHREAVAQREKKKKPHTEQYELLPVR